ncbi:MAG: hypothetical protein IJW36_00020 [Clostridia bacterium]|nr:hypothetical protein [Clostridia bacterium]
MSVPVSPVSLVVYKVVREYEKSEGKQTLFYKNEVFHFVEKALKIASMIDEQDYWLFYDGEEIQNYYECLSKICDMTTNILEINENKLANGGQEWAEKKIGSMPYSFLKGAVQVLEEAMKEKEGTILCD